MKVTATFTLRTVAESGDGALLTTADPSQFRDDGDERTGARRPASWDAELGISTGQRHGTIYDATASPPILTTHVLQLPWSAGADSLGSKRHLFAVGCRSTPQGLSVNSSSPSSQFIYEFPNNLNFAWVSGAPQEAFDSADYPVVGSEFSAARHFVNRMHVGTFRIYGPNLFLALQSDSTWLFVEGEEEASVGKYDYYGTP